MILADKIINERKKNGWSQEELAEQLSVSRQSVSKWEGAQSVPDIQKIIQMSKIFGVSTDYLLKDDAKLEPADVTIEDTEYSPIRKVSLEEANEFIELKKSNSTKIALATALCILSPVVLIFLAGLSQKNIFGITENLAAGVGLLALFLCIVISVSLFILTNQKLSKFDFLKEEEFETQYGVSGMVKEQMELTQSTYTISTVIGSILCITSPIPIIIAALLNASEYVLCGMVCVLLIMVAVAVMIYIISNAERSCYTILLQEGEYTKAQKKINKKTNAWASAYWSVVVVIYLGWSFATRSWGHTWIVWPVAGVAYGALAAIVKAIHS